MTDHELTRRDALKALGAAGITVAGGAAALTWDRSGDDETAEAPEDDAASSESDFGDHERETYRAVAAIVYPSEVAGVQEFVDGYVAGRIEADPERAADMAEAVAALDAYTREWEGTDFVAVDAATQEETLRGMGVQVADPDPHGDPRHRVRYYLVNDLLFALYSSPTGGELVGIENPQGYPGGTGSYQQPPNER
ncbi:twin-arginine translocation signal domain-containing protein [Haloarcula sp. CBA1130]|uniref:gluconate 2-dehydrogenase subunit 3 family protein n=1 Tax=unclassified Haloarcula TaxID=2624677 RepID=UPI001248EC0B|nr:MULTISPECIES: gluconate 2-dehydrogenase subunit 3 family protein [unclassified Haloarcula]KAA9397420.1 twin-arginine translocation signal domain-containing protein [Haloarcula sp. CBA1129]KAA9400539.1 twin-arginine translocation signal domain-containing protein [Haloarcula sp. CBA1130]KAA9402547.1 twin-arginine translocation signal domain-containing protein [Haloarcula sp. CBA1130]